MRVGSLISLVLAGLIIATEVAAQSAKSPERGLYLTVFRSPSTGLEWRAGHAAVHAGFYPTVISRDGDRGNANFARAGVTWYAKEQGNSIYVSPSFVWSLDRDWKNGALTEAGFRGRLYRGLNGRLGVGLLTSTDGEVRVNPTVGMDIKLGAGR
jgi:hypothetical protein